MNLDENPNDSTLARELRDSLSELAAPARPSLAAITSRGRAHQRRRLAGFASLGITGVAAASALALSLTGVLGAAPASITGTIRTAAFTLTTNANGTDTLRLREKVWQDPAALQRALRQDGVPALVKTGTFCASRPQPEPKGYVAARGPLRRTRVTIDGRPRWVWHHVPPPLVGAGPHGYAFTPTGIYIRPSAFPPGTELFFGYGKADGTPGMTLQMNLIDTNSFSCSSNPDSWEAS
jgi:hypothetical protein